MFFREFGGTKVHFDRLYEKFSWRVMVGSMNPLGKGGKGVEALMAAMAARSRFPRPDCATYLGLMTLPLWSMVI